MSRIRTCPPSSNIRCKLNFMHVLTSSTRMQSLVQFSCFICIGHDTKHIVLYTRSFSATSFVFTLFVRHCHWVCCDIADCKAKAHEIRESLTTQSPCNTTHDVFDDHTLKHGRLTVSCSSGTRYALEPKPLTVLLCCVCVCAVTQEDRKQLYRPPYIYCWPMLQ